MNPHVQTLFALTRRAITKKHIEDFSPGDPGYPDYVKLWSRIHEAGEVPKQSEFDLSEVIGLTGWSSPCGWASSDGVDHSERFRQYRRFTSAVAVALIVFGNCSEEVRVANYLARDLLMDVSVGDQEHFNAVRSIFPLVREALRKTDHEEEYPFFTLGSLILAHMAQDYAQMPKLAEQLIEDDAAVRKSGSLSRTVWDSRLLFGLTSYDQVNKDWVAFVSRLTNPTNDESVQLVIESFVP